MNLEAVLRSYGLIPGDLSPTESIIRCGTSAHPRKRNGWYIVYPDYAIYGNWENGDGYEYWSDKSGDTSSPEYIATLRNRTEKLRREREAERERVAHDAQLALEQLPNSGHSDYAARKHIRPTPSTRYDQGALIIPMQDANGKIWSFQRIYPDGKKYFLGGGRTQGCYHAIFPNRQVALGERVIVCEGYATGCSIHASTDLPVIVAFNAGNLKAVCDSLPYRNILIAADNDVSDVGEKSARDSGYRYILPAIKGQDFNDVLVNQGPHEVANYFIDRTSTAAPPLQVHGLVGDIAEWITRTAIRPQPMLSIAAALSFVSMLKGHHVHGYTDLRTNLLVLSLGPTSSGKEHPQNCIKRLATLAGVDKHMLAEPVSGAGFLRGLVKSERIGLLVMDEIGRYIGNLSNKNAGSWQREILDYMIKSFSCANSTLKGRQYADDKKNPTIDIFQPHFCCLGSTVVERFQEACGSSEIIDGFLNRWILFASDDRPDRQEKVKFSPPSEELLERIRSYAKLRIYSPYGEPELRKVKFTPEAWDHFSNWRREIDKLIKESPYPLDCLYARTAEHVEKVALTLSDSEDVLVKDVKCAIEIVNQSNVTIRKLASAIADSASEQDFLRVAKIIEKAGEIKRGVLSRKTQFIQGGDRRRAEIIATMIETNLIAVREEGSKRSVVYKWIGE